MDGSGFHSWGSFSLSGLSSKSPRRPQREKPGELEMALSEFVSKNFCTPTIPVVSPSVDLRFPHETGPIGTCFYSGCAAEVLHMETYAEAPTGNHGF